MIVVVVNAQEVREVKTKTGTTVNQRYLTLGDQTTSLQTTMWGNLVSYNCFNSQITDHHTCNFLQSPYAQLWQGTHLCAHRLPPETLWHHRMWHHRSPAWHVISKRNCIRNRTHFELIAHLLTHLHLSTYTRTDASPVTLSRTLISRIYTFAEQPFTQSPQTVTQPPLKPIHRTQSSHLLTTDCAH